MSPVALALAQATAAKAEWREASSTHFVIYGNESESTLRQFALNLERYHAAMALLTGTQDAPPSPSNRVTIYAVGGVDQVRKLYGENASRYLGGFYQPRAGATIAIVPDISGEQVADWDASLRTVLHEYAHHFLIGRSGFPLPGWINEGAAEFYSSASFEKDGAVNIGRPNPTRLIEANTMANLPIEELLGSAKVPTSQSTRYTAFYAKSWLLYHYLVLGPERRNQLKAYSAALGRGLEPLDAARDAFGDLAVLDREIASYRKRPRFTTLLLKGSLLPTGAVTVRVLSEGEARTMPLRIRQRRGIDRSAAPGIAEEMRSFARQFPQDATVQAALAEAEHDAGNHDAAIAAANAALALDPRSINAHVQKSLALMSIAGKSRSGTDIDAARKALVALNRVENDHPLPLVLYYVTFVGQGRKPSEVAVRGLQRAAELAPFDLGLRMTLAVQQIQDGKIEEARGNLLPVAYNPHGGKLAERARFLLDRLSGGLALPTLEPGQDAPGDDDQD